jgi:hypothetical protein
MRRFTLLFLCAFALACALFAGAVLFVDPYGVLNGPAVAGFNARKTRTKEDGGRIAASHLILTTHAGTVLLGDSRVVDGFPDRVDDWPGGLVNAGMRGANGFELARAAILAAHNRRLRCAVIGVDMFVFSTMAKAKATYWISALPDANRTLGVARMALAPQPFVRAVQTVADNATDAPESRPWKARYPPGWVHKRFFSSLAPVYDAYATVTFDPQRFAFLASAIDALTARGVQVVVFVHPIHAFREEAMVEAGREPLAQHLRAELAELKARFAGRAPRAPCVAGPILEAWDFSGFQPVGATPSPSVAQTVPDAYWYETPHYTPRVGAALLQRLRGGAGAGVFADDRFGVRLDGGGLARVERAAMARRAAWLAENPDAPWVKAELARAAARPAKSTEPTFYLNRDDLRTMDADVARLKRAAAR